jgi:hypothetical protein
MSFAVPAGELVELHFEDGTGKVRVTPADNSLLLLSVEEAIAACRAFKTQLEFKSQFDLLLNTLGTWINAQREKIAQAFLTTREGGLLFLLVTKSRAYDDALEAEITALDLQVANDTDFHLIDLNILAIPSCDEQSVQSFLSRKMVLRYVIDGDRK